MRTALVATILGSLVGTPVLGERAVSLKPAVPVGTLDSILVLPTVPGKATWAVIADLSLGLRIPSRLTSGPAIDLEIVVMNAGTTPFWVPDNLALSPGMLDVSWSCDGGPTTTRRVVLGSGPRCGSDMTTEYVFIPAGSYFGRRIQLNHAEGIRPARLHRAEPSARWPVGRYDFRVRMSLAEGNAEAGVPGGVFESGTVQVEITN